MYCPISLLRESLLDSFSFNFSSESTMQEPSIPTRFLHFRKLPKKVDVPVVKNLIMTMISDTEVDDSTSVTIRNFMILHGRGQAIVELLTTEEAKRVIEKLPQSSHVSFGKDRERLDTSISYKNRDDKSREESTRALDAIIRQIVSHDSHERELKRKERKRKQCIMVQSNIEQNALESPFIDQDQQLYDSLPQPCTLQNLNATDKSRVEGLLSRCHTPIRRDLKQFICWESVKFGLRNNCKCHLLHCYRPVTELPAAKRVYEVDDNFTSQREQAEVKRLVNTYVAEKSKNCDNVRCLVLDGQAANTSRAIINSSATRSVSDIIVPNYVSSTIEILQQSASDVCTPFFGSVRALFDSIYYRNARRIITHTSDNASQENSLSNFKFGLVYLDYCCRFNCGYRHVEQAPRGDLEALFSYGLLSNRSQLIICLCKEDSKEEQEGVKKISPENELASFILEISVKCGYKVVSQELPFEYGVIQVFAFSIIIDEK